METEIQSLDIWAFTHYFMAVLVFLKHSLKFTWCRRPLPLRYYLHSISGQEICILGSKWHADLEAR